VLFELLQYEKYKFAKKEEETKIILEKQQAEEAEKNKDIFNDLIDKELERITKGKEDEPKVIEDNNSNTISVYYLWLQ
jgi:hypothetical protein